MKTLENGINSAVPPTEGTNKGTGTFVDMIGEIKFKNFLKNRFPNFPGGRNHDLVTQVIRKGRK